VVSEPPGLNACTMSSAALVHLAQHDKHLIVLYMDVNCQMPLFTHDHLHAHVVVIKTKFQLYETFKNHSH
jgi:hypothetical protein